MLSFFPRDVLDEIWDLIESVSEGFPTYSRDIKENDYYFYASRKNVMLETFFLYFMLTVSFKRNYAAETF